MSFRIEQKILIGKNQIIEFKNLYQKKKIEEIISTKSYKKFIF